jgi:hypothetical protein
MKAFILSLLLLVVVTAAAVYGLHLVPMSAQDVFTEHSNVRL